MRYADALVCDAQRQTLCAVPRLRRLPMGRSVEPSDHTAAGVQRPGRGTTDGRRPDPGLPEVHTSLKALSAITIETRRSPLRQNSNIGAQRSPDT